MVRIGIIFHQVRKLCSVAVSEMKYLNVAEKNDAAKTIAGFLSNGAARRREGYSVYNKIYEFETNVRGQNAKMVMTSVSGHLMNYEFVASYRNWNNCDPQQLFDAPVRKACIKDNESIKRTLEREVKSCQGLIVWTDCDREGENIGFEIIDVCKAVKPNIPVYRARFSEITATAARRALANLIAPDKKQSEAVDIRQELDLRTGAAFTRFQTLRLQRIFPEQIAEKLISYGSCQIPTLGFVAARYKEAEEFVSEPFWKLKVTHTIDDLTVEFNWARNRLFDKEACEDYLVLCLSEPIANVESVVTKPKNKWRPVALDTVELEKLGSRKLKINAKNVLAIAEKLYQQGYISYPRTETNQFSKEINLRGLVENHVSHPEWGTFASRVMEWGPNPRNGNKSDEAHPPIHPIKCSTGLNGDEKRIYELIVRHFLACVSKDATGSETIVNITIAGEKFHANGLCIYERNYLDVYPYEKWNAKQIHRYETGQTFEPTEITMQEGATTAPPLLTEADLIALMDKHGIGTDATHAEHINTIKERGYIGEVDRGFLVPGTIGMGLYEGYHAIELPLAEPVLRAEFEVDLKRICTGERNPKDVLSGQIQKYKEAYRVLAEKVRSLDEQLAKRLNETPQQINAVEAAPVIRLEEVLPCPKCSDSQLLLRQKRESTSSYLSCARFPDCKNAIWFPDDIKSVKISEATCNRCGPNYHLLEFKFKQMHYLGLLNASGLAYETCIACDNKFRHLFQINVESVKKLGAIVSDQNNQNVVNRNNAGSVQPRNTQNARSALGGNTIPTVQRPPANSRSSSTSALNPSTTSETSRYRGWGSLDTNPGEQTTSASSLSTRIEPEASHMDDMFNDNLDDIFLNDDWSVDVPTTNNVNTNTRETNENFNSTNRNSANSWANNDGQNNWGNNANRSNWPTNENRNSDTTMIWGSSGDRMERNPIEPTANSAPSWNHPTGNWGSSGGTMERYPTESPSNAARSWNRPIENRAPGNPNEHPSSLASPLIHPTANPGATNERIVRCTVCNKVAQSLVVRKEGPNTGRQFYSCSTGCSFFQWADSAPNNATRDTNRWSHIKPDNPAANTVNVLCSCNRPASERTVRKDGPNKGRQFFVCSKENTSCDFFKWAEENMQSNAGPSWGSASNNNAAPPWGTGGNQNRNQPTTSRGASSTSADNQPPKKRKCGLCRQEGHTKVKCPRKEEFENH